MPTPMHGSALIACPECDLLQGEVALPAGGTARCNRCDAVIYRSPRHGLDRSLAFTLAAAVLLVIANCFPIASLDVQGQRAETTLLGAVLALYEQGRGEVATLVLFTALVAPAVELAALCYVLLPRRQGLPRRQLAYAVQVLDFVRPWSLVDVLMLGIVVSLVKLAPKSEVVVGVALWSFGGLILLLAALATSFELRELWPPEAGAAR
jgi:paraquat-inducible protein A